MIFEIQEDKLKQLIFKFLEDSPLSRYSESDPWNGGGIPFYGWESDNYDEEFEDGGFEPDIMFVYYEYPSSYDFNNTYDDDMFPLVEILEPYCSDITNVFTENLFFKHSPKWFEDNIGREVKTVSCG